MLLNSVLSTTGASFTTIDIKNFYLGIPMDVYEYMQIRYDTIQEEIKEKYNLSAKQHNGYIYLEIQKGIYGLKKSGVLANKHLQKLLETYGYIKTTFTPGLWKHKARPIILTLESSM